MVLGIYKILTDMGYVWKFNVYMKILRIDLILDGGGEGMMAILNGIYDGSERVGR